jgi:hypothetical protein
LLGPASGLARVGDPGEDTLSDDDLVERIRGVLDALDAETS